MKPIITYVLLAAIAMTLTLMVVGAGRFRLPGNQQDYEPDQPVAYSHRLHAGELGIDCQYCHTGAERSRYAGIPPVSTCMNCHKFITATWGAVQEEDKRAAEENRAPRKIVSPEIAKFQDGKPLSWNRIHQLPDFAYFDHRPHVYAGVKCQTCHGPVETMDRVRQFSSLSMGWCVNCHRDANASANANASGVVGKPVHAPLDCTTCHN